MNCFAEDVPVCTKRGLIPIKDVEISDMVLTEDGTFQKVVNKINQGYREKLLFINVDRMPNVLKVTPDHKIMTQRGWVEAKDLTDEDYVSVPGCNNIESVPDEINILDFLGDDLNDKSLVVDDEGFIRKLNSGTSQNPSVGEFNKQWLPVKNKIKIDEDFMKFIGYYISEGCAENNGYRTIFTFSGKEQSYAEEVKALFIKIFGKAATVQDYDTWMQVGTSSRIVNSFMKNFIGAGFGSKILPWWFLNLPNNFLNILLAYTCRGDAHIDQTTGSIVLVMCNPNIMMQLFYIAQKLDLGMSFSFLYKKEDRHSLPIGLRITKKWTYSKNFDEISDLIGKFKIRNDKFFRKINSVTEIFYGKDVWDISVDVNHSLQVAGMVASNCFVVDAKDSREGWSKATGDMLVISGLGGGVGINFSKIRPKGEKIKGTGGHASGPLSLMKIINNVGEEIKNGGGRRVALMFCLNIDHPDILDFLKCKHSKKAKLDEEFISEWQYHFVRASNDPEYLDALNIMLQNENSKEFLSKMFKLLNDKRIQNANISVVIPEGQMNCFIDAVKNDLDWEFKWKGKVKKKIKAKSLWKLLIDHAYESAEPGILNFDLAERMSNISYVEKITSTNPCLVGDTLVAVADGRNVVSIADLAKEGKDVPVYTHTKRGSICIRMMRNPRITGYNVPIYKITLDDGSTIKTTANHKFKLKNGNYKEVKNLVNGDSLFLMTKFEASFKELFPKANSNSQDYIWINNGKSTDLLEHRLIAEFNYNEKIPSGYVVHHKDHNAKNNHISNLQVLSKQDHDKLHSYDMMGDNNPMRRAQTEWSEEKWNRYSKTMSEAISAEKNGRYLGVTNDQLKEHALELTKLLGHKISISDWETYAKPKGLPIAFSGWRKNHLGGMSGLFRWAANELGFEHLDEDIRLVRRYNKYLAMGYDCEIINNDLVFNKRCENCSNAYQSYKIETAYCSFSCSNKKNWMNQDPVQHSIKVSEGKKKNHPQIRELQVKIYSDLKFNLKREPLQKEWKAECKNNNISSEIGRLSSPFINFSKLKESAEMYNHKVESVELCGYENVYNGTVDDFHNFFVGGWESKTEGGKKKLSFINNLQCGEIPLQPNGVCCLGSLVLPRFYINNDFRYDLLENTIKQAVRFLDNVLTINKYPTNEIKKSAQKYRRIGLGVMGLHDLLLMIGHKYNSQEGLDFVDRLMNFIKECVYQTSIDLAKEKGSFNIFNFDGYSKSEFYQNLSNDLKEKIKMYGIRNCALLSIAPTGTISSVCGVTSGIEPIFAYAYKRKYFKGDQLEVENIIHPLYREFIENSKSVDHFQSSYDLSVKDHLEIQKVCQKHTDQAISKTINISANYPKEELYDLFLDYLPYLKGLTMYVDGSRGGAPLESLSYEEASQLISCPNGVCNL
ncbi:MAG TPA: HNH endonuclease [Chitinophagales bacterium]|nr:HNH endonuclease [Chitinophagales bacterium]HNG25966.1 HNH endonuclease [Chitinophagales bacterium]